jgi:homoserine kinase
MQGENWLYAHADNVALPFGWIYVSEKLQPVRYYKIESPSELYATVVHPQIELKTSDARSVLKQTVSLKAQLCNGEMWAE